MGERVNDARVTFEIQEGKWAFAGFAWGPPDSDLSIGAGYTKPTKIALPVPCNNIEDDFAPGVAWKRLPDGIYVKYVPNHLGAARSEQ